MKLQQISSSLEHPSGGFPVNEGRFQLHIGPKEVALLRTGTQEFGFASIENAISDELLVALRAEAALQRSVALSAEEEGEIPYKAHIADLGEVAKVFLASPAMTNLVQTVFGERLTLTDGASCYTYYEVGDFLSAHCDRLVECATTIILYLDAISPDPLSPETGLVLRVYGKKREEKPMPRIVIPTRAKSLVVGRGSHIWHERPPLQKGERVMALTACLGAAVLA